MIMGSVDESNTSRVSVDHLSVSTRQLVETGRVCADRKSHEHSVTDPLPRGSQNNWYCQPDSKKLAFCRKVSSCNLLDRTPKDDSSFRSRSICRRPWGTTSRSRWLQAGTTCCRAQKKQGQTSKVCNFERHLSLLLSSGMRRTPTEWSAHLGCGQVKTDGCGPPLEGQRQQCSDCRRLALPSRYTQSATKRLFSLATGTGPSGGCASRCSRRTFAICKAPSRQLPLPHRLDCCQRQRQSRFNTVMHIGTDKSQESCCFKYRRAPA